MSEIETVKKTAEKLKAVRASIEKIKQNTKDTLAPIEAERNSLQEELLTLLGDAGIGSIKVDTGESFARVPKKEIVVTNPAKALSWAKENNAIAIDRRIMAQKLKEVDEMPDFFEPRESFYISIRKPSKK